MSVGKQVGTVARWFLACGWALALSAECAAQAPTTALLNVTGRASLVVTPDVAVIRGRLLSRGALAADARQSYAESRRRVVDALAAAGIAADSIGTKGVQIVSDSGIVNPNQVFMIQQQGQTMPAAKVGVDETLEIRVRGIRGKTSDELLEQVMKLADVCKDAGLSLDNPNVNFNYYQSSSAFSFVTFEVSDLAAKKQEAAKMAIEDAKRQAAQLAELAGVKLGAVHSLQASQIDLQIAPSFNPATGQSEGAQLQHSGDVPLNASIQVSFEIAR